MVPGQYPHQESELESRCLLDLHLYVSPEKEKCCGGQGLCFSVSWAGAWGEGRPNVGGTSNCLCCHLCHQVTRCRSGGGQKQGWLWTFLDPAVKIWQGIRRAEKLQFWNNLPVCIVLSPHGCRWSLPLTFSFSLAFCLSNHNSRTIYLAAESLSPPFLPYPAVPELGAKKM